MTLIHNLYKSMLGTEPVEREDSKEMCDHSWETLSDGIHGNQRVRVDSETGQPYVELFKVIREKCSNCGERKHKETKYRKCCLQVSSKTEWENWEG